MLDKLKIKALVLVLFLISAAFFTTYVTNVEGKTSSEPPFLLHVILRSIYSVDQSETESWGHEMIFHVGDPDGVDNLFMDGNVSFSILSPDGITHPLPGEDVIAKFVEGEIETLSIQWFSWFSSFPVFGEYKLTVWDADGLSVEYVTLPTKINDVPLTVPTISYPQNFDTIYETIPTFAWEIYTPENGSVTYYNIGVLGEDWNWTHLRISNDTTSVVFNFDNSSPVPELFPGQYNLGISADIFQRTVFVEDRYIESINFSYQFFEDRGAEANRQHIFNVSPTWEYVFEGRYIHNAIKISTDDKYFQVIGTDKTFSIKYDPNMKVFKHFITINFKDIEIRLFTIVLMIRRWDFCLASAKDNETGIEYNLIDINVS